MFVITFVSLLEGISTLLLITLINTTNVIDLGIMNHPYLSFLSFFTQLPAATALSLILLIYLVLAIGIHFLSKKISIQNTVIQTYFLRKIRYETYITLFQSKWDFFLKKRKSDLINIIDSEVSAVSNGVTTIFLLFSTLIFAVIQISIALVLSPTITIFILISGLFLVIMNRNFLKKSYALGYRNYELGKEYFAGLTDQMNGIKDIKSNSLEEKRLKWFDNITKEMEKEQIEYTTLKKTSEFYYNMAFSIFVVLFIFASFMIFESQTGQLILIILLFSRLWPQVKAIQSYLEYIAAVLPSFKIVQDFQEECKSMIEFQDEDYKDVEPLQLQREIECRNVYFSYNSEAENQALKNINLTIPANQMTAFVGKSGAGKSTIIDLVMGLNMPGVGEVRVDGVLLTNKNLLALRKVLSYVPQDPFLFNTSIRENLMLLKENATEEELWEALTFASAKEFVEKLPNGIDTIIGDRGIKLSGGERQRLVLARAILKKPSILILDEATSALDSESESKIQEAIESLKGNMTIIVIAHRLSTIQNADQVIVLEDGQIIQQGTFAKLAQEHNEMFSQLLQKQKLSLQSIKSIS